MLNVTQVKSHGLKSKNVVLSNALIRSAQGLNLVEKRILMAAITRMAGVMQPIEITAQEYADTFDIPVRQGYWQLKEAVSSLLNRHITYQDVQNGRVGTYKVNWLSSVFYTIDEGFITV